MPETKTLCNEADQARDGPLAYEKPIIEEIPLQEMLAMAQSAVARSGMGMCKYTFL